MYTCTNRNITKSMNMTTWTVFTTRRPPARSISPWKRCTSHIISPVRKVTGAEMNMMNW